MNIYWKEMGGDKTDSVVFIHGGGMSNEMWAKYVDALKDFHCIILDLPEHGKSIDLLPFSISRSVEEIAELIRLKAHGGKAHVIGHSIGGIILIQLFKKYSDLVRHAIVASANLIPSNIYKFLGSKVICSCMSFVVRKNKKFKFVTPDLLMKLNMEIIMHSNIPKELSKIENSVLFLCGEKEIETIKLSVINSMKIVPNSKGAFIKKASHSFPVKKPDLFIAIINDWISKEIISNELLELKSY
jgi:pimeloyl-ACP methyl ester carboxylesterase